MPTKKNKFRQEDFLELLGKKPKKAQQRKLVLEDNRRPRLKDAGDLL